jgi:hexosaminidase
MLRLEQCYLPDDPATNGALRLRLFNVGDQPVAIDRLSYTSLLRPNADVVVQGGTFLGRFANKVDIGAPDGFELAPGQHWEITLSSLNIVPRTRTLGALSAWVMSKGEVIDCTVGDLPPANGISTGPIKDWPNPDPELPICLLPWPKHFDCDAYGPARLLRPVDDQARAALMQIAALHKRLFPAAADIVTLDDRADSIALRTQAKTLPDDGYEIDFGTEVTVSFGNAHGWRHGLIAVAQIAHAASSDPRFRFPTSGHIQDSPRHDWRGVHLDVARNFMGADQIKRLLDIMAWHRMNRFHWHLTDDEAWRLPIKGLPELTDVGGTRGLGQPLTPQYAEGSKGQRGSYSFQEVRDIVAHGLSLGIETLPEVDLPGHNTALLAALPHLADSDEQSESYHSIQGYPNNAINPGMPETWVVLEQIFDTLADLFPFTHVHLGGDEVDEASWSTSPKARAWAHEKHVQASAATIQSAFMRDCQQMLQNRGRQLAGWDECADGGGVDPQSILFAWRSREKIAALMQDGYTVVATPGQHYYLDMAQGEGWNNPGLVWAGISPLQACYDYDAGAGLPDDTGKLAGVQACMWSELIDCTARFNYMAFPRLSAVAEAGWTPVSQKSWPRFAALSHLMPQL